ncbi:uncharacterized protein LOC120803524 isoform X2 [Xiphias gladius]|uniref:uncharacterized protein LOC120803524 isoform X2 n=1 Tax=Xiphias gladius TaxID=8245 RepID=UPI001A98CD37|nr:uncharacterized protein LOC120803524 isoform X2 [Xiphias gladius]
MAGNGYCIFFSGSVFIAGCAILLVTAFPVIQITIGAVYMYECPAAALIPVYLMVLGILALLVMGVLALPRLLCPAAQGKTIWSVLLLSLVLFIFVWFLYGSYQIYSVYPPNYDKNITDPKRVNNSVDTPTAPDSKLGLTLEKQNQSLPNLNQTRLINNNQTLRKLIQTLALGNISSKTNREHLNAPQARRVMAAVPYCDRTVYLFAFWTTTLAYVFAGKTLITIIFLYGFMKIAAKFEELLTT